MFHLYTPRLAGRAPSGVAVFLAALPTVFLAFSAFTFSRVPLDATKAPAVRARRPVIASAPAPAVLAAQTPAARPGELNCLAKVVYYEARGESADGQAAVAQVVLNRTRRSTYPRSVCGVVYQGLAAGGCQFSFICDGAMRRPLESVAWTRARRVAARALGGHVMTAVGQAVSFHAAALGASRAGEIVRIGGHVFLASAGHLSPSVVRTAQQVARADPAATGGADVDALAAEGLAE